MGLTENKIIENYNTYVLAQYRNNKDTKEYFNNIYKNLMFCTYIHAMTFGCESSEFKELIQKAILYYQDIEHYDICLELTNLIN